MQKQKEGKRKEYVVRIGELMMQILKEQIESIKEVTYGSVKSSYLEAGEVHAKKFLGIA